MQQFFPDTLLFGGDYNPEQWPKEVWQEDMRLMKLAHITMVSINIFSWALLEPAPGQYVFDTLDEIMNMLAENGIMADLATGTASPPTWMSRLYPSMLPVTQKGVRMSHGSRQHYCPNSPDFRRTSAALVQQLATRYAQHPALKMWHINNEYGVHTAQCYCDNCAAAFRIWLQERYSSLDALNAAWSTTFWSQRYYHWEDVLPPRITPAQNNPVQTLDYWRFMDYSLLGCYRVEEEILRKITPNIPLTTNFISYMKAVDPFTWAPHVDIMSFDMYPEIHSSPSSIALPHDIMRSTKNGQPHLVMEMSTSQVNWREQNPHKRPGQMRLHILQALAHGANGTMFFQWRQSQAGAEQFHSAVVSHDGTEHTRIFRQVAQAGAELQRLAPIIADSRYPASAAILVDWDNWRAVEYQPGPSTRLNYIEQMWTYYNALYQHNIAADFVQPTADLSQYRLIVAPLLYLLKPGVAANFERFVEQGGTLLVTYFSGIADQYDHVFLGGYPAPLRKLLGIWVEEFDPWLPSMTNEISIEEGPLQGSYPCSVWGELIHLEGAQALGTFTQDYIANHPALTVNQFGSGHAYYIATLPGEDLSLRLMQHLSQQAELSPTLSSPTGVEVTRRVRPDGTSIYFLLNHTQQAQQISLPEGTFTSLLNDQTHNGTITLQAMDADVIH